MYEATIVRGGAIKKTRLQTLNYVQFERSLCFVTKTLFRTCTSISTGIYFRLLRPDQCVLVSNSKGIHNVCVCIHHQNPKLLVEGAKMTAKNLKIKYDENLPQLAKEILIKMACAKSNEARFFRECSKCPGVTETMKLVKNYFEKNAIDTIQCKEWETVTMKCDLVKHDYSVDEYFNKLQTQVEGKLLDHDFIATIQSDYIKTRRHNS